MDNLKMDTTYVNKTHLPRTFPSHWKVKVVLELGFKGEAVTLASMFTIAHGIPFPLAKTSWELKKKTLVSLKEGFCSE